MNELGRSHNQGLEPLCAQVGELQTQGPVSSLMRPHLPWRCLHGMPVPEVSFNFLCQTEILHDTFPCPGVTGPLATCTFLKEKTPQQG